MKIITLNMNMFRYLIDGSLNEFLKEYQADVVILQEVRSSLADEVTCYTHKISPNLYQEIENIKKTIYLTVALCKDDTWQKVNIDHFHYNNRFVKIKNDDWSIFGLHLPLQDDIDSLLSIIQESDCDIICGDFNAHRKYSQIKNWKVIDNLINDKGYSDLWEKGLKEGKAYYIDYKGEKKKAQQGNFYRTFVGNTHIDYVLAKADIHLIDIIIDMRTLAFTDHCAMIVNYKKDES